MITKRLDNIAIAEALPSPKGVALAILELCSREDVTLSELVRVAHTDPALTGRLIHQANAAAAGNGRPVASATDAIQRLGMTAVRNLALSFSLVDQYQHGPCPGFDYQAFWSHSLLMGLAMQRFASMTQTAATNELFACGLMARIGHLALATAYPAAYDRLLQRKESGAALIELEREHLHTDHNELTAVLLTEWGLPGAFVEPVLHHEQPDASGFSPGSRPHQLVHLFFLAKCVADLGLAPESERNRRTAQLLLLGGKIGLNADQLGATIDELVRNWQQWGALLKVPAAALPSFEEMSALHAPRPEDSDSPAALRVLLVDDDATTRCMLEGVLGGALGHSVVCASNAHEALAVAVEANPQIVITDWMMPGMSGLELARALRAAEWGKTLYLIMLTSLETENEIAEAFESGVDDYLVKPVNLRTLRARLRAAWHYVQLLEAWERDRAQLKQFAAELAISNRRLEHAALTDLLTDLPNRRAGMEALAAAWSASSRTGQALAVMTLDIDHFKRINDQHGHAVGDQVLREVAQAIRGAARRDDKVCRLGGEEFLVVCQNADLKSAFAAAERIRRLVRALAIGIGGTIVPVSLSVGVAAREPTMGDTDALLHASDTALYGAKNGGRDRVCACVQGRVAGLSR